MIYKQQYNILYMQHIQINTIGSWELRISHKLDALELASF